MKEYLLNLCRINQKIRDPSEFYEFGDAVERFLQTEDDHGVYKKSVQNALKAVKRSLPLSCIVKIASLMKVKDGFLSESLLKRLLKRSALWDSILQYLSAFKIDTFDKKIARLVQSNSQFSTEAVYCYVREKKYLVNGLLESTDPLQISKQLDFIINCKIYSGIEKYIHLLGHRTKTVALKAFEMFWIFCRDPSNADNRKILKQQVQNPDKYYVDVVEKSLNIDESRHFIIFGWSFLVEKDEILNTVRFSDLVLKLEYLNRIVMKYAINNPTPCVDDIFEADLCEATSEKDCELLFKPVNIVNECSEIFDHMFDDNYKKDICDCYEF